MTSLARTPPAPKLRAAERALRVALAGGWAVLVWALLTWPPPPAAAELGTWLPWPLDAAADKLGHAALFLVQALLAHRALRPESGRRGAALAAAAVLTLAYGGATELRQRDVAGRHADVWDFVADGAGVALAVGAARRFPATGRSSVASS